MAKRSTTTYSNDFKEMIVSLHASGMKLCDICREYAVPNSTVRTWLKQNQKIVSEDGEVMTVSEIKALKKKLSTLKMENEILKKAMGIFAKEKN